MKQATQLPDVEQLFSSAFSSGAEYNLWCLWQGSEGRSLDDTVDERGALVMATLMSMGQTTAMHQRSKALVLRGDEAHHRLIASGLQGMLQHCSILQSGLLIAQGAPAPRSEEWLRELRHAVEQAERVDLPSLVGPPSEVKSVVSYLTGFDGYELPSPSGVVRLVRRIDADPMTGWEEVPG